MATQTERSGFRPAQGEIRRQTELASLVIIKCELQSICLVEKSCPDDFDALPKLINLHDVEQLVAVKCDEPFQRSCLQIEIVLRVSDSLKQLKQASLSAGLISSLTELSSVVSTYSLKASNQVGFSNSGRTPFSSQYSQPSRSSTTCMYRCEAASSSDQDRFVGFTIGLKSVVGL